LRELLRGAPFGLKAEVLNQQGKLINIILYHVATFENVPVGVPILRVKIIKQLACYVFTGFMFLLASQLPTDQWYEAIGDNTLADAILDRLMHNAHRINLKGESMRKKMNSLTQVEHLE